MSDGPVRGDLTIRIAYTSHSYYYRRMRPVDESSVLALARAAGIEVSREDLALLTRSMQRCAEVLAVLDDADLDGTDLPATNDPRVGW